MTKNQNDERNQQSDSKSHQERTQEGKKKEETNPNNPKSTQSNPQGSVQDNEQRKGTGSPKGQSNMDVRDTEENEEEETNRKPSSKPGNQNPQKGNR